MIHLTAADIAGMEQRYRAQFVNSLPGYKNVCLVGTANQEGLNNLAIFNSLFHVGANPPLLGLVFRPDSVDRHTLLNIRSTNSYTISLLSVGMEASAHQTSARYPQEISEFEAVGLTPLYFEGFPAPAVKESPVRIGLEIAQEINISLNGTVLIIGQICHVEMDEQALQEDGFINPEIHNLLAVCGLDAYYRPVCVGRYAYAKPDKAPSLLK
jgi:flavin reductase (DIM6/NTAB) family NADH-FMN oxidoreductase RutF